MYFKKNLLTADVGDSIKINAIFIKYLISKMIGDDKTKLTYLKEELPKNLYDILDNF